MEYWAELKWLLCFAKARLFSPSSALTFTYFFSFRGITPLIRVTFCGILDVQQRRKTKNETSIMIFCLLSISAFSPSHFSSNLPCELIMLCGWSTGAVLLGDISRDCLMWQKHTTLYSSVLYFAALAAPQLCSLTVRTGFVCPGATSAEPPAQIHVVSYTLVLIRPFKKAFLTVFINIIIYSVRDANTLVPL